MVFSFFKKQPEKRMAARPAAIPHPRDDRSVPGDAGGSDTRQRLAAPVGLTRADVPFVTQVPKSESPPLELSEFVFSESAPEFQLEADVDPVDALAEEAAMLYANAQDGPVRVLLENALRSHRSPLSERLWLMLFDLFRLTGQKAAFEALEIEYAQAFEKSPPVWRESGAPAGAPAKAASTVLFKGDLTGLNQAAFDLLHQALGRTVQLRVDLSKVRDLDNDGCQRLLDFLQQARRREREVELIGRDMLAELLSGHVVTGKVGDRACWLLKLELCQAGGQLDAFEETAINYAVTFEISPPSWESSRVPAREVPAAVAVTSAALASEAYVIRGEVRGARFSDLLSYAAANDPVVIDCAAVTRMDFLSAGTLLNVLTTLKRTGRHIVFRHPNYLLAELFRVVGLQSVAEIALARN